MEFRLVTAPTDKVCPRCKQCFPIPEFRTPKGGKKTYCRECTKAFKHESYSRNKETALQNAKRWARENAERYKENQERYRNENRGHLNAEAKVYRLENADVIREKDKLRQRNPEDVKRYVLTRKNRISSDPVLAARQKESQKRYSLKWYAGNRGTILLSSKNWRNANVELARARTRKSVAKWCKLNPDRVSAQQRQRSALRRGARIEGFDEAAHEAHLLGWQRGLCLHCHAPLSGCQSRDHFVPVAKGGPHSAANLVLCCQSCNSSKNNHIYGQEWNPALLRNGDYVIADPAFTALTRGDPRFVLLSTFMLSDRNCENPKDVMLGLKAENITLIFDYEWESRRSAVTGFILNKLGESSKIGARSTRLVDVGVDAARQFFDYHHLQGFGAGGVYLGLEHDGKLVGCSAWKNYGTGIELNRMAFDGQVVGGFSKMLSGLLGHEFYAGQPIFSFVDPRYADGHSYEKVGFQYKGETSSPLYYYVNGCGIYHRRNFTKENMGKNMSWFDPSLTEQENAHANGYFRLHGLKQRRYLYAP